MGQAGCWCQSPRKGALPAPPRPPTLLPLACPHSRSLPRSATQLSFTGGLPTETFISRCCVKPVEYWLPDKGSTIEVGAPRQPAEDARAPSVGAAGGGLRSEGGAGFGAPGACNKHVLSTARLQDPPETAIRASPSRASLPSIPQLPLFDDLSEPDRATVGLLDATAPRTSEFLQSDRWESDTGRVTRVQCIFKVAQPRLSRAGPAGPAGMQTDNWQCRGSSIRPAMLAGDGEGAVGSGAGEGAPHGGRGWARGAPAGPAQHSLATQGHQRTEPSE